MGRKSYRQYIKKVRIIMESEGVITTCFHFAIFYVRLCMTHLYNPCLNHKKRHCMLEDQAKQKKIDGDMDKSVTHVSKRKVNAIPLQLFYKIRFFFEFLPLHSPLRIRL